MTRPTMSDWLAGGHDRPEQVRKEWRERGIVLLPIGRAFDAVRLPERVVFAALGTEGRSFAHTDFGLEESLGGPVIHDGHGRTYYAIVPPGTVREWRHCGLGVECLGHGTHFGVPAVDVLEYDATQPIYWATLGGPSKFCEPASVSLLVRVGAARLADAEGRRPGTKPPALRTARAPQ
ncbi:hypothetical protein [Streptomyces sp. NBC_01408]|uniref:hypothetical protein n=1 Tax=Streptomyces sp. NBC_01408 TaxID=2903855 RepID=UPI002252068C|nr:hypothetical protein [Streptomyces sp. NBC_01408]MCX4691052.1 hypothetical protein [Streptomyces sp. NBC_01408]